MTDGAPLVGGIIAPTTDGATVTITIDAAGEVTFRRVESPNVWIMSTHGRSIRIEVREAGERVYADKENAIVADTMREIAAVMLARSK